MFAILRILGIFANSSFFGEVKQPAGTDKSFLCYVPLAMYAVIEIAMKSLIWKSVLHVRLEDHNKKTALSLQRLQNRALPIIERARYKESLP